MTRYDNFQDLIYLSRLKIDTLFETLPQPLARRIKDLHVNFMGTGVGGGVDPQVSSTISKLPRVVDAICFKYAVKDFTDTDLSSGQWFIGEVEQMAYGPARWDWSPEEADVVFFTGTELGVSVLLGGSAQHLLDREVAQNVARTGSTSERLRGIMEKVIAVEEAGTDARTVPTVHRKRDEFDLASSAHESFYCIDSGLNEIAGSRPLKFLARAIDVFPDEGQNTRLVVGTPLFVAAWDEGLGAAAKSASARNRKAQSSEAQGASRVRGLMRRAFPVRTVLNPGVALSNEETAGGTPISALDVRRLATLPSSTTAAPSLDIELYIRPASAGGYARPEEYYEAYPRVSRRGPTAAVGNRDFVSRDIHWFDDQGGAWLVSYSCADTPYPPVPIATNATIRGNLVATRVSEDGARDVLVLAQDIPLRELEESLQGYQYAKPRLKWIVDHVSDTAAPRGRW